CTADVPAGDNLGNHTATTTLNIAGYGITGSAGAVLDANGGWVRTYNSTGWYNGTYGGGMYMTDANYVRVYNAKGLLADTSGLIAVQGNSASSYGVQGTSGTSVGVRAASTSNIGAYVTSGSNYAVYAATSSSGYGGVIGYAANGIYGILGHANAYSLYGNGQIYVSSTIQTAGSVYAASFYHSSDRRLKKNITDIEDPFKILGGIGGKRYEWKKDGKHAYGVIAQDVEKVMPEAVSKNPQGYLTVDYDQLIAPLVEAVKQLKADNDNLHAEIRLLKEGARD
ncbi:MAG: tail fiber domain-containing protein, partial [Mesorhizobium sp.]